ncbi:MAG: sugar phosphate isomerase/epimerase [Armatimonadetes bacterium]|nr:sugar phosphate isomerase/epimerase [Armatimonadota bacterium]MDW8122096.1 sugar phosphate isomerase/epimerase [Armatimonadota bacterium]
MRIGFITNGTEQDLQFARSEGIPVVEVNIHQNLKEWEEKASSYQELLSRYGIKVNAMGLWGKNYISPDQSEAEHCLQELKRHLDLASFLGARVVMTGGGLNEGEPISQQAKKACAVLKPMVAYAQEKGLMFAFYNCHWTNHVTGPEAWDIVLKELPGVGIKFDPSHPINDGLDYLQHARDYAPYFVHLHAKGTVRIAGEWFDDPPAGMDQTNWPVLFAILYKHNYQGDINIEPHSATWMGDRYYKGIRFSKRYLESFIL